MRAHPLHHGDKLSELGTLPPFHHIFWSGTRTDPQGPKHGRSHLCKVPRCCCDHDIWQKHLKDGRVSFGSWLQMSVCPDSHIMPGSMHWRRAACQQDGLWRTAGDIAVHQEVVRMGLNKGPLLTFESSVLRVQRIALSLTPVYRHRCEINCQTFETFETSIQNTSLSGHFRPRPWHLCSLCGMQLPEDNGVLIHVLSS